MKKPLLMAKKFSLKFCFANIFPVHGILRILTMLYRTKFRSQWYQLDKSIILFPVDHIFHLQRLDYIVSLSFFYCYYVYVLL